MRYAPQLYKEFPSLIFGSVARETKKQYLSSFQTFKNFCDAHGLVPLPCSPSTLSAFVVKKKNENRSPGCLKSYVSAVNWVHSLAGYDRPGSDSFVTSITSACTRHVARPIKRKLPVTKEHVAQIVDKYCRDTQNISDFRTGAMLMLMYYGFLRFNEVSLLQRRDLSFFEDRAQVEIRQSKTDQLRQGSIIPIKRGNHGSFCPVNILEKYVTLAHSAHHPDSSEPLFYKLSAHRPGTQRQPLTYTLASEIASKAFSFLGLPATQFSLHSFRSGGASTAAASGLDGRLIQRHGRWKTSYAKDRYIEDSLKDRLDVSKNL